MENQEQKKSTWGGARAGAGRKKTRVKYYGFSASPEVHAILEAHPGSKAEFINQCILRAVQNEATGSDTEQ